MPRLAVIQVLLAIVGFAGPMLGDDPHLNPQLLPRGCSSCHEGHGVSDSPMLPRAQRDVCLECHDSQARLDEQIRRGRVDSQAKPALLGAVLSRAFQHPLTENGLSRFQEDVVVCSSCHSPHRRSTGESRRDGTKKISTRSPRRFEHELCDSCHGKTGPGNPSPADTGRLFDSTSKSFHPVRGPAGESSPSVRQDLGQKMINCTDCHRASRRSDPAGPHGSDEPWILGAPYVTSDGAQFSERSYGLCLECHDSAKLLSPDSPFPPHELHVVDAKIACASCHSAHGSIRNRALIRIGEETRLGSTTRSLSTGRLEYVSDAEGSGSCYLTCHGFDHGPAEYGGGASAGPSPSLIGRPFDSGGPGRIDVRPDPESRLRPKSTDRDRADNVRPPA